MTKELSLLDAITMNDWFDKFKMYKIKELPIKIQWKLLNNIKQMQGDVEKFKTFREGLVNDFKSEYFGEEKSDEIHQPKLDEQGNEVHDAEGNVVTESLRQVKPEFVDAYKKRAEELNTELQSVLAEKNTYEFTTLKIDELVDTLKENSAIELDDLDILSAFDEQ